MDKIEILHKINEKPWYHSFECVEALNKLKAPDPYSRTKENDGRRLVDIDGGWQVLNHAKYRAKLSRADYFRQYRASKAAKEQAAGLIHGQTKEEIAADALQSFEGGKK